MKNNIKLNKLKPIFVKKKNGVLGQKLGYDKHQIQNKIKYT